MHSGDEPSPQTPATTPLQPGVAHVGIRLPPFWSRSPFIWFQQVEAQFLLAGITSQITRYRHLLASLPPEIAMDVADIIANPPAQNPYDHLKSSILQRTTISERTRLQQLLHSEELGDRRPSQLLRAMQVLLADRAASLDDDLLRELFLSRLPSSVQMVLATATALPLAQLAQLADKVTEVASPSTPIAAVSESCRFPNPRCQPPVSAAPSTFAEELSSMRADINRLSDTVAALQFRDNRSRSPSRSGRFRRFRRSPRRYSHRSVSPADNQNPPPCWYHERFGQAAMRCTHPCGWSGNAPGNR
ncbi:uncharacterized protein LOC135400457 [Ornithodoros turicata]|uniref:uncharacterized protein LOC135400457 n=2 Tax=Ornithodoros turicata TaxID=34597 RepID=UPI00313A29B6